MAKINKELFHFNANENIKNEKKILFFEKGTNPCKKSMPFI